MLSARGKLWLSAAALVVGTGAAVAWLGNGARSTAAAPESLRDAAVVESTPIAMQRVVVADVPVKVDPEPTQAVVATPKPDEQLEVGTLVGRVFDAAGQPAPHLSMLLGRARGAEVDAASHTGSSNAQGYFSFGDVPVGRWEIGLESAAYFSSTWVSTADVVADETTVHDVVLEGTHSLNGAALYSDDWKDPHGCVIRLDLFDVTAGAPRIVASAYARTRTDVVQTSGRFEFAGLRPGLYELRAYPFAENDYCTRPIDLTGGDLRLPAFVFGTDLLFREDPGHPSSKPYDTTEDDRDGAEER